MKGDNTTWLANGVPRKRSVARSLREKVPCVHNFQSVRISSQAQYNGGLFILDLNKAPWGCGKL